MNPNLKSCPSCRALIDSHETRCPYCDADLNARRVREVELGPGYSRGVVTGYLIAVCVLFFIFELIAALGTLGSSGMWQGLFGGIPADILLQMGARYAPLIEQAGEWWRLVVPIFLHANFLHLLFNGMALVQVGPLAEQAYGRARFFIIFMVSGVAGSLLGYWLSRGSPSVGIGASGALFGLIGSAGLYGHRRGDAYGHMIRRVMVQWGLYALVFGLLIRADNAAHIGGLVSGLALSFIVGDTSRIRPREGLVWNILAILVTLVTLYCFAMAIYGYTEFGRRAP
jgi:rhomboid protease GluP